MKTNKKQQFINCTYDLLQSEGIENISIRRLAKEMGCTSTVLYTYFDSLEHLITLTSVRYLEGYISDFKRITNEMHDPIETNMLLWESFVGYALADVDIFEMLFFGKYKENLLDIVYEYYEIFSKEFQDMDGLIVSVMFNGDLRERDYIMYRRAASMGYLELKSASMLSQMDEFMFHGMLMDCKNKKLNQDEIMEKTREFAEILRTITKKFSLK